MSHACIHVTEADRNTERERERVLELSRKRWEWKLGLPMSSSWLVRQQCCCQGIAGGQIS